MNATINVIPPITAEQARAALRVVVDPEVGVNIVDLGLVYHIEVAPDQIKVALTMTSPACPLSELIIEEAEGVLRAMVADTVLVSIGLVWSPPWDPSMMSDKARENLGW